MRSWRCDEHRRIGRHQGQHHVGRGLLGDWARRGRNLPQGGNAGARAGQPRGGRRGRPRGGRARQPRRKPDGNRAGGRAPGRLGHRQHHDAGARRRGRRDVELSRGDAGRDSAGRPVRRGDEEPGGGGLITGLAAKVPSPRRRCTAKNFSNPLTAFARRIEEGRHRPAESPPGGRRSRWRHHRSPADSGALPARRFTQGAASVVGPRNHAPYIVWRGLLRSRVHVEDHAPVGGQRGGAGIGDGEDEVSHAGRAGILRRKPGRAACGRRRDGDLRTFQGRQRDGREAHPGDEASLRIVEPPIRQRVPIRVAAAGGIERQRLPHHAVQHDLRGPFTAVHRGQRAVVRLSAGLDRPVHSRSEVVLKRRAPAPDRGLVRQVRPAVHARHGVL